MTSACSSILGCAVTLFVGSEIEYALPASSVYIFSWLISLWVGLRLCASQTLGDACPDPSCSGLKNATCRFGACDCLPGFFNTGNNTCQPFINSSTINITTAVPFSVSASHGMTNDETRSSLKESSIAETTYATSSTTGNVINSSTINITTAVPFSVSASHGMTNAETRSSLKESSIAETTYATSSTTENVINSSTKNITTAVPRSVSATHGMTTAETRSSLKESSIAETTYATSSTTGKEDCNDCNIKMIAAISAVGIAIVIILVTVICCLRYHRGRYRLQKSKQEQHKMSEMSVK